MSLNIELAQPDVEILAEIAQAEGREPAEYASHVLHTHLASRATELKHSRKERPNAHDLAGKYRHINVSTETLRQSREEELAIEEAKYARRFGSESQ